jgi:hypothetical protein
MEASDIINSVCWIEDTSFNNLLRNYNEQATQQWVWEIGMAGLAISMTDSLSLVFKNTQHPQMYRFKAGLWL